MAKGQMRSTKEKKKPKQDKDKKKGPSYLSQGPVSDALRRADDKPHPGKK